MQRSAPTATPKLGYYRHTDGGFYQVIGMARDSRDGSMVVLYEHIWPFEAGTWTRPVDEWGSRFTPVTVGDVALAQQGDRAALQAAISAARLARRGVAHEGVLARSAAPASVTSVASSPSHVFSKPVCDSILLLAGLGVDGDTHCGVKVQHRSRVAKNPDQPNLRQVHLVHSELFDELAAQGFTVRAGELGENITTHGIALLDLPTGARLHIGATAVVEITGLRNPCTQIDQFRKGLMAAVLGRDAEGGLVRKTGVMGVVIVGGPVLPGDQIAVVLPSPPLRRLEPV